jgi:hypothetical protein
MNFLNSLKVSAIMRFKLKQEITKPTQLKLPAGAEWWASSHVGGHVSVD